MPPQRTIPSKALKTERTHEENQERYDIRPCYFVKACSHCIIAPTSQLPEEVIEV